MHQSFIINAIRITLIISFIAVILLILAIGPYLPHPKRWQALINKTPLSTQTNAIPNKISVIIPTYNDGYEMLSNTISTTLQNAAHPDLLEIIVVDGSGQDNTISKIVNEFPIKIATASGGRGPTINAGIQLATGNILLMLHADCILYKGFDTKINHYFSDPNVLLSAFQFYADSKKYSTMYSVEKRVAARSKYLWLPYGDQALAIRKSDLHKYFSGKIPNYAMMEDFELVWKLRDIALDHSKIIAIIPQPVFSSPRRFLEKGTTKTTLLNWLFVTGYVWGNLTPNQIFQYYYQG